MARIRDKFVASRQPAAQQQGSSPGPEPQPASSDDGTTGPYHQPGQAVSVRRDSGGSSSAAAAAAAEAEAATRTRRLADSAASSSSATRPAAVVLASTTTTTDAVLAGQASSSTAAAAAAATWPHDADILNFPSDAEASDAMDFITGESRCGTTAAAMRRTAAHAAGPDLLGPKPGLAVPPPVPPDGLLPAPPLRAMPPRGRAPKAAAAAADVDATAASPVMPASVEAACGCHSSVRCEQLQLQIDRLQDELVRLQEGRAAELQQQQDEHTAAVDEYEREANRHARWTRQRLATEEREKKRLRTQLQEQAELVKGLRQETAALEYHLEQARARCKLCADENPAAVLLLDCGHMLCNVCRASRTDLACPFCGALLIRCLIEDRFVQFT